MAKLSRLLCDRLEDRRLDDEVFMVGKLVEWVTLPLPGMFGLDESLPTALGAVSETVRGPTRSHLSSIRVFNE